MEETFEAARALERFRADVSAELGRAIALGDVRFYFELRYSVDMAARALNLPSAYDERP
jgi:hypothetical protein